MASSSNNVGTIHSTNFSFVSMLKNLRESSESSTWTIGVGSKVRILGDPKGYADLNGEKRYKVEIETLAGSFHPTRGIPEIGDAGYVKCNYISGYQPPSSKKVRSRPTTPVTPRRFSSYSTRAPSPRLRAAAPSATVQQQSIERKFDRMEKRLDTAEKERRDLMTKVTKLNNHVRLIENKNRVLNSDNTKLRGRLRSMESENKKLSKELRGEKFHRTRLQQVVEKLKTVLDHRSGPRSSAQLRSGSERPNHLSDSTQWANKLESFVRPKAKHRRRSSSSGADVDKRTTGQRKRPEFQRAHAMLNDVLSDAESNMAEAARQAYRKGRINYKTYQDLLRIDRLQERNFRKERDRTDW